jgi:hypothetical protein
MQQIPKEKEKSKAKLKLKKLDMSCVGAFVTGYAVGCAVSVMLQLDEIISIKVAQHASALQIQSCVRRYVQHGKYISIMQVPWRLRAAILIQRVWRGHDARMLYYFERDKWNVMRRMQQVQSTPGGTIFLFYPSSFCFRPE